MGDAIFVRHRTASGRLDACWEFDAERKAVELVFRLGSADPVGMCHPVCPVERPRIGAFAIARLDGSSWRILPSCFLPNGNGFLGELVQVQRSLHPLLDRGTQILLTHAPDDVVAELEAL